MAHPADLSPATQQQQNTWSSGDFSVVAAMTVLPAGQLCDVAELRAGQTVLDVATGSGNVALAAARYFCRVTGVDFVPALLQRARERAEVEHLEATFVEGDAQDLPFGDASFDAVLSQYGAMFAPDQSRAAGEIVRVCRPGGIIGLASWTPESQAGSVFRITAKYLPPPPGANPPTRWGTEEGLRELFGDRVRWNHLQRAVVRQRFFSMAHFLEFFQTNFGPTIRARQALDDVVFREYENDVAEATQRFNVSGDETLVIENEYLEAVGTRL